MGGNFTINNSVTLYFMVIQLKNFINYFSGWDALQSWSENVGLGNVCGTPPPKLTHPIFFMMGFCVRSLWGLKMPIVTLVMGKVSTLFAFLGMENSQLLLTLQGTEPWDLGSDPGPERSQARAFPTAPRDQVVSHEKQRGP